MQTGCLVFQENDLDPNSFLSQIFNLDRILNSLEKEVDFPAPSSIQAMGGGSRAFIQWTPVDQALGYRVYYSDQANITKESQKTANTNNLYTFVENLNPDTVYYIRIATIIDSGVSPLSTEIATAYTASTQPGTIPTGSYHDISAGQGVNSGFDPSIRFDSYNNKILTVSRNIGNGNRVSLFRCELDGTGCTHTDLSLGTGLGIDSGYDPYIEIDKINRKMLVTSSNGVASPTISLLRCELDGSNCNHTSITNLAGQPINSSFRPKLRIDYLNRKILIGSFNASNDGKPSIYLCEMDLTSCAHRDLSLGTGQGTDSGAQMDFEIDYINKKIISTTVNIFDSDKIYLFRCDLDGTGCSSADISAGTGGDTGRYSSIHIDPINEKMIIVAQDAINNLKPAYFRCNLDGSNCVYADISANSGISSHNGNKRAGVYLDFINNKILVVTQNNSTSNKAHLFRCDLDGANCSDRDISSIVPDASASGIAPSMDYDPVNGRLIIATMRNMLGMRPNLLRW